MSRDSANSSGFLTFLAITGDCDLSSSSSAYSSSSSSLSPSSPSSPPLLPPWQVIIICNQIFHILTAYMNTWSPLVPCAIMIIIDNNNNCNLTPCTHSKVLRNNIAIVHMLNTTDVLLYMYRVLNGVIALPSVSKPILEGGR